MSKYKQADLKSELKSSGGYSKSKGKSPQERIIRPLTNKENGKMSKLSR